MKRLVAAYLSALVLVTAAGCADDDTTSDAAGEGRIRVVANFYPVAEAAEAVGGGLVEVTNLTPAGAEPHDLELLPRQVDQLLDADLVLYLGGGFQPAVEEIAGRRDGPSVDLLDDLPLQAGDAGADEHGHGDEAEPHGDEEEPHAGEEEHAEGEDHAEGEEEPHAGEEEHAEGEEEHAEGEDHAGEALDPHFWLDPRLMADAVERIRAALAGVAPEHADTFAANAEGYRAELEELDADFEAGLTNCERRVIVTSHAAFHYLADRYGLRQLPIAGLSPESEPTPRRLAELADLIASEGVTTVFYETLVSPSVAETLAREAGVQTAVLNPIEGLSTDDVKAGEGYVSVMRRNLDSLRQALGCS